jgi:hypothetical protein
MRTKTLLLTAALAAAGAASAMAQNVYSVNAVGYVNKTVNLNYTLVANPFVVADDSIGTLIPFGASDHGITLFNIKDDGSLEIGTYDPTLPPPDGPWDHPEIRLELGKGALLYNPPQFGTFNITFVGEVAQGTPVHNTVLTGFTVRSSKVPQAGPISTLLGLTPNVGITVLQYAADGVTQLIGTYDPTLPPTDAWDPAEPSLGIGEAFFLTSGGNANWDRNFTVN